MERQHLYTVIVEVYQTQEVFIDQVCTTTTDLDKILFAWVEQAVSRGFIKGTDDPRVPFRDITERSRLEPLDGVFNIWRIGVLIGKDFYIKDVIRARHDGLFYPNESINVTIDFIKTSMSESSMSLATEDVLGPTDYRYVRQAEEKYASCLKRHEFLKGVSALSRSITQERRRVEKQLIYWDAKRRFYSQFFNRDAKTKAKNVYTVRFDYEYYHNSGVFTYQLNRIGSDPNYVLYEWAILLMHDTWRPYEDSDERAQIIKDQDRLLLMGKISSGSYAPVPVTGCMNLWTTYFSLSGGMVKLTITKTARDEVVQG